ncbi:hypothetical protein PsAD2_03209 [Pseudovibrio axinellae]|uniref:Uncharacterized protein n=1 Tax=Pseudovibrio axinellae TaxID=989403 RepID=A0A165X0A4_9HYPH|nr:hypothetical protein PsAD2_03209 [Pseudovibrio axinellae]
MGFNRISPPIPVQIAAVNALRAVSRNGFAAAGNHTAILCQLTHHNAQAVITLPDTYFALVKPAAACHIALNGQGVPICAGCGLNATAQDCTGHVAASKIAFCLRTAAIRTNHRYNTLDPVGDPIPIVIIAVGEDKPVCAGDRVDLIGFAAVALIGRRNQRPCASTVNTLHLLYAITLTFCSKLHVAHCACGSICTRKSGLPGDHRTIAKLDIGGICGQVDLGNTKLA